MTTYIIALVVFSLAYALIISEKIHRTVVGIDKEKVITDLREQYMKSLTGYNSIKNNASVDSEDLNKFNSNLKKILGKNKDFYLYGDRNFID